MSPGLARFGAIFAGPQGWPASLAEADADSLSVYRSPERRILLTRSGRCAIDLALQFLDLTPGDEVLIPAYACGCEADVVLRRGLLPVYYRVDARGIVDMNDALRRAGPKARVLYLVHTFGFPQPAAIWSEAARARGLRVIEDCAHAIFGRSEGELIGTRGDFSIFSFNKTLGLPDGGMLLVNAPNLSDMPALPPAPAHLVAGSVLRQLALGHAPRLALRVAARVKAVRIRNRKTYGRWPNTMDQHRFGYGPTLCSQELLRRIQPAEVVARKRHHYSQLLGACPRTRNVRPLLGDLPDGVSPMVFPLWCENREALHRYFLSRGIVGCRWWGSSHPTLDTKAFPDAAELRRHVFALPTHSDLDDRTMAFIMDHLMRIS